MRRPLIALALVAMTVGYSTPSRATRVQVPTGQPTITAALATSADTILVAEGDFLEDVHISRSVVLLGSYATHVNRIETPTGDYGLTVVVSAMRSARNIRLIGRDVSVSNCWADSGLACSGLYSASVSSCTIFGGASVGALQTNVTNCRVFGGGLVADGEASSYVTGNYIEGPAAVGLTTGDDTYPSNNVIRNCTVGIQAGCASNIQVTNNVVLDCASSGIQSPNSNPCFAGASYIGNLVMRCGGDGMNIKGLAVQVQRNRVQQVTGTGIVVQGTTQNINDNEVSNAGADGIRALSLVDGFLRNRAVHCGQNGLVINGAGRVRSNTAGNNGADGFHIDTQGMHLLLQGNTSYLNTGDAYDVTSNGAVPDTVDHNIGFIGAYGLRWTLGGGMAPARGCNDWYGNTQGPTSGVTVAPTDLLANPLLCDPVHDVILLSSASPVLNPPGCGLIGVAGAGCTAVAAADGPATADVQLLQAYPLPSAGGLRFAWPRRTGMLRLQVLDAAGSLRWTRVVPGEPGGFRWDGVDEHGRALAPGVYFTRLIDGASVLKGRVVIMR